ncbi:cytochrome P450 [Streptomyces sp. SID13031]|uniref:cytochrome P450 n=1 Tax=Streptomyces sp. SID13031 TaxID=2706046 RepID=UPI0013CDCAEC|nr:cytochrome P450 [Streptomyces sp. SID13031]NEA37129.1 cytochrome P450 [Streptomyces sp. SID13031]
MTTVADLEQDPHAFLARIRPVGWSGALGGWVVSSRELAMQVMRDPETFTVDDPRFSTAQVVGPSMLSLDGSAHAEHRAPFEHPFSLAQTRARFTSFVSAETDRLVSAIAPLGSADLRTTVAGPLSVAVVAYSLGLDRTDAATVLDWYQDISSSVSGIAAGQPVTAEGAAAFAKLHQHVAGSIDHSDSLIAEAAGSGLGTDEVVANAAVLMFGGIETTEGMITNCLWHLLTNPSQLALVLADHSLIPNAIEESLRLEPAAAVVDRYATRDLSLAGASIKRGDFISVSLAGANRDPAVFPDPDQYDVRRSNARRHLAFASGPHICLGMHLARLEAVSAITAVLTRLPDLRLSATSPPPVGLVFRKPSAVDVSWTVA